MSEQSFTIQPHPAKDNVPPTETTPGLGSAPTLQNPHQAKPPHVPSQAIAESLEKPKTREELQALQAKLNKE